MTRELHIIVISLLVLIGAVPSNAATNASSHLLISFPSGNKMLLGYLYRPAGNGPFPAVIFHHGHHQGLTTYDVSEWQPMANLLTTHGYMLFVPDRHPNTVDKSEYSEALQALLRTNSADTTNREAIEKYDLIHRDVLASLQWLKQQPDVDTNAIVMAGQLSGAQQALYEAEKLKDVRAFIAFSPAALSWKPDSIMCQFLTNTVQKCSAPMLLLYTENQGLGPAEALGPMIRNKPKPNRLQIYSATGSYGKNFIRDGVDAWGPDVTAFLEESLR